MDKLKYGIETVYEKELKELSLLDKLMLLDTDYVKYNDMINEKAENLIKRITGNQLQFMIALKQIATMDLQYYNDLLEYEQEVINEEVEQGLYDLIIDTTQNMHGFM